MTRYAACIEYDGTSYHGWQRQQHVTDTVQSVLEKALSSLADQAVDVIVAGRTDAGVHASHQIVHFDSSANRNGDEWLRGTNRFLPQSVRIQWVIRIDESFHARFSAIERGYRYIIDNKKVFNPLQAKYATSIKSPLNMSAMIKSANYLLGEHDYSAFRAAGCQANTPHRHIKKILVQKKENWVYVDIFANAFLQHMVRNIVGSLLVVGIDKAPADWVQQLLIDKDRKQAGATAPAHGLYLTSVSYTDEFSLPSEHKPVCYWGC